MILSRSGVTITWGLELHNHILGKRKSFLILKFYILYQATTLFQMASEGLQIDDVIQILSVLADEANLQVTVKESLKGGLITGVTTVIGALIGGRIGLAVGAVAGGIGAAAMSKDFQDVGSVLLNMDHQKKEILFNRVKECCAKASISDIGRLNDVISNPDMKTKLLKIITDHVESQLKMDIVD